MYNKFEEAAIAVAMTGPGCGGQSGHTFRLGAVLVDGSRIVSSRYNSYKTHPKLRKWTRYPYLHAESSAILTYKGKSKNLRLYVARIKRDNSVSYAKPCLVCQAIIRTNHIEEVYYTNQVGTFQRLV